MIGSWVTAIVTTRIDANEEDVVNINSDAGS